MTVVIIFERPMCAIYAVIAHAGNSFSVFYTMHGAVINIMGVIHNGHTHCIDSAVIDGRPLAQKATPP
jgi:hypothetical protein